jgi:hypothetical protein
MSTLEVKPKKAAKKTVKIQEEPKEPKEPKPRKSRAKKQPTREEMLKILLDGSNELKQIIVELKEEESKLVALQLHRVPELLKETIGNLEEDVEEMFEKYQELLALPAEVPQAE